MTSGFLDEVLFNSQSCELLKKRTLTLMINNIQAKFTLYLSVVNCLKREH